ncbi:MAG: hypothetical protein WC969_04920 [Elusimicrobiota bacterium]|jgi:hypothetical protein
MRPVKTEVLLSQSPAELWKRLARPEFCLTLSHALRACRGGASVKLHGAGSPPAFAAGARVAVLDARGGRESFSWDIRTCEPPYRLELAVRKEKGFFDAGEFICSLELLEAPAKGTRVQAEVFAVMFRAPLELLSLLVPVRWLYARAVRKAVKQASRS